MTRRNSGGRTRALVFLALSSVTATLAAGLVGAVVAYYGKEVDRLGLEKEALQPVMVASRDVWQGKTLDAADLEMRDLPVAYIPAEVLEHPDQAIGRVPRERILAQEFIRSARLADPAAGVGLNAIIPRGMRAMSIDVGDGSAVSGFLVPGNFVDVLVTVDGEDGDEAQTVTLLQAVTVLAVNRRMGGEDAATPTGRPSVTVAVGPDLAEKLTHAVAQGDVTLTLRSDIDVTHVQTHGEWSLHLLGTPPEVEGPAMRMPVTEWPKDQATLTIISGPNQTVETLE